MGLPKDIVEDWVLEDINRFDSRLVGSLVNGTRKISGQLMTPPDSALGSASSSSSNSTPAPDVVVPMKLYSVQALQYIGFDVPASTEIFWTWTNYDDMTFEEVIFGYLRERIEHFPKDWRASMKEIGISEELQDGIMDPAYEDVRCTRTMPQWVTEFIEEHLWTLETMSERLSKNILTLKYGPTETILLRDGAAQDRARYDCSQPGYTALYRATSGARLAKALQDDGIELENMVLWKQPPNDFSLDRTAYYWTKDHWGQSVCVMHIFCPTSILNADNVWKLEFGDDWKKLVWHSGNNKLYPTDIHNKWGASRIIIGPVSINRDDDFYNLKSWKDVEEGKHTWVVGAEQGSWTRAFGKAWADCHAKHIANAEEWVKNHQDKKK